mgnify:CR=1 FL=1
MVVGIPNQVARDSPFFCLVGRVRLSHVLFGSKDEAWLRIAIRVFGSRDE